MRVAIPTSDKPSKYRNKKTEVDGIIFDSKKEAARYQELSLLQQAGEIRGLILQPKFDITVQHTKVCTYKADFEYVDNDGALVVEDAKGIKTPVYRLKKKLMRAVYGIEIKEV